MVHADERTILIKIVAQDPADAYERMQNAIIDTLQHLLWAHSDGESVVIPAKVAKGMAVQLEQLRASLLDIRDYQAAVEIAKTIAKTNESDIESTNSPST